MRSHHRLGLALLLAGCAHDPCCGRYGLVPECPIPDPNRKTLVVRDANIIVGDKPYGVRYVDDGTRAIYGGDIILGPASELRPTPGRSSMTPTLGLRWSDRTMPVSIDASASGYAAQISAGLALWSAATTMQFPTRTSETDHVVFRSTTDGWGSSSLGRVGGEQTIFLPSGTDAALVAHEVGHALGLWHEHQRPDRDTYIDVHLDRLSDPGHAGAFGVDPWESVLTGGEYDYASVMHYYSCAFAKRTADGGCEPTITRKDGTLIPWNAAITDHDACGVLQMYDLPAFNARCNTVTTSCRREQQGFTWSCDGQPSAPGCVQIAEPSDPHGTWTDNWLCPPAGLELEWSYSGEVAGKRCVAVREGAEPDDATWTDNYLCWRSGDYSKQAWRLHWSMAGPIAGLPCVQWAEPSDPATWTDNYLCWSREWWPVVTVELTDIDDDAVLWVGTPSDDDRVCSARFQNGTPGSQTCGPAVVVRSRKQDRMNFTLKFGNGGAFDSQGRVRILIDGQVVKDKRVPKAVRHTGWFYRLSFDIDAQVGAYHEIQERDCPLPTDCMN